MENQSGAETTGSEADDDLCDYEKMRIENIRKNREFLLSLGLGEPCKLHLQPMRGKGKRPTENKNRESSNEQSVSEPVIMTRTRYKGMQTITPLAPVVRSTTANNKDIIDTAVCSDVVSAVREELVQGEEDEDSKPPKCQPRKLPVQKPTRNKPKGVRGKRRRRRKKKWRDMGSSSSELTSDEEWEPWKEEETKQRAGSKGVRCEANDVEMRAVDTPLKPRNRPEFKCEHCGKTLSRADTLRVHRRIHTGEKPFKCEYCGRAFNRVDGLHTHRKIHTGEKLFKCEYCGRAFNRVDNLQTHRRIHTGEKPFKCGRCGKAFTAAAGLCAHRRTHVNTEPSHLLN